ncbi:MAG TPA: ribonuclease HIII [bacterium]|nr:ribonuclease HIII [bacterium]
MVLFSNNVALSEFVERAYAALLTRKFSVIPESFKEIDYGISFKLDCAEEKKSISVSIYHTEKKGFSFVTKNPDVRSILNSLLTSTGVAGSDEAGKGDLFGPLVVCSFLLGEKENELLKLNIKDSKKLKNHEIVDIYRHISKEHPSSFSLVRIMPERYNSFYKDLAGKGRNLNYMLAWAHSKALSGLIEKRSDIKKIIVDRFTENPVVNKIITDAAGKIPVEFFVRAEQNPAVAAASIIARANYLISLKNISETVLLGKFELISGSGSGSDELLAKIIDEFGTDITDRICKTHFANLTKNLSVF